MTLCMVIKAVGEDDMMMIGWLWLTKQWVCSGSLNGMG